MITVKRFPYNLFQVNTFVLHDETKECIIIDAGMDGPMEENELSNYIESLDLKPVLLVLTHAHIDHILGNNYTAEKYNISLAAHPACVSFISRAPVYAQTFGVNIENPKEIDQFLDEARDLKFGNSKLKVLHTPGHADGSLCFYSEEDQFVITGDVLFNQSIGRTDLPTGDYDVLQSSIWEKLFTLPDETVAYPGHGPETTIGFEKINNPFVAIGR